jgi:CheY-like chemotaxis protein
MMSSGELVRSDIGKGLMNGNTVGRPMEILLVEDSLTSARLTMGALRQGKLQHRLSWLTAGDDALEFLRQRGKFAQAPQPDLILLDLGLPGQDGREVLTEIKADSRLKSIPVVVLTASTSQEDIARTESLNVESYLTKPVDMKRFLEVVKDLERFWHADMILPTA